MTQGTDGVPQTPPREDRGAVAEGQKKPSRLYSCRLSQVPQRRRLRFWDWVCHRFLLWGCILSSNACPPAPAPPPLLNWNFQFLGTLILCFVCLFTATKSHSSALRQALGEALTSRAKECANSAV